MDYTEGELLAFIERHDEHEDYYRSKLAELRGKPTPVTVEDVAQALAEVYHSTPYRDAHVRAAEALLSRFNITERKAE